MPLQIDRETAWAFLSRFTTSKPVSGDDDEIHVKTCPVCGDGKWRVYFNVAKGVGFCQRNGCKMDIFTLARPVFGTATASETVRRLQEFRGESFRLVFDRRDKGAVREAIANKAERATVPAQEIPRMGAPDKFKTDWEKPLGRVVRSYADARGLPTWWLNSGRAGWVYGVRRLFALVLEGHQVVYWVARAIDKGTEPRYLTPQRAAYGNKSGDVVFNLDLVTPGALVVVTEGFISALSAGDNAVAILGHHLTRTQAAKITTAKPGAVVFLREEGVSPVQAMEAAWEIQRRGIPAYVADLVDGDPNDNPAQVPEVLQTKRQAGRSALVASRLSVVRKEAPWAAPKFTEPEPPEDDQPFLD